MMFFLYSGSWRILLPALKVLSRWGFTEKWRLKERIIFRSPAPGPSVWFHCASIGEAKGLAGFLSRVQFPDHRLLLTAATRDGAEYLEDAVFSSWSGTPVSRTIAPLDHPGLVRNFLAAHQIRCLCLYEGELWPGCLAACRRSSVPILLIGARTGKRSQALYRLFRKSTVQLFGHIDWIQAQSPEQATRLLPFVSKMPSPGADFKILSLAGKPALPRAAPGQKDGFAFISLHRGELHLLLPAIKKIPAGRRLYIFPRYLKDLPFFKSKLIRLGFRLFSEAPGHSRLLVDAYGKIPRFLEQCRTAFVGGTLVSAGGHNLLEPLAARVQILTGPHCVNQEPLAGRMRKEGLAVIISRPEDILSESGSAFSDEKATAFMITLLQEAWTAADAVIRQFEQKGISAHRTSQDLELSC